MTTIAAPPVRPDTVRALSDRELERELTLAALRQERRSRFELLLSERRRRMRRPA
jgi:hypothetical protein